VDLHQWLALVSHEAEAWEELVAMAVEIGLNSRDDLPRSRGGYPIS
jgi:hypothetical protein